MIGPRGNSTEGDSRWSRPPSETFFDLTVENKQENPPHFFDSKTAGERFEDVQRRIRRQRKQAPRDAKFLSKKQRRLLALAIMDGTIQQRETQSATGAEAAWVLRMIGIRE